jgi:signal transduction histidine kinase
VSHDPLEPAHHPFGGPGRESVDSPPPVSMTWRLWRGLVVLIFLLVGAGALIYTGVRHQDLTIDTVVQRLQPLESANLRIRSDFAGAQAGLRGYLITRQGRYLGYYRRSRSDLAAALTQANRLSRGGWRHELAIEQRAATTWFGYADRMRGLTVSSPALARLAGRSFASARAFYGANSRLHAQVAARVQQAARDGRRALDVTVAWSAAFALAAVLLAVAAAVGTVHGITKPLAGLTMTLRRLRSGDHAARADLTGAAETVEVARTLNDLADDSDRLRAQEERATRLRQAARAGGVRIREHLRAQEVISEARLVLEGDVDAEVIYLHLMEEGGGVSRPIGHEGDWLFPDDFARTLPAASMESFHAAFRNHTSLVTQDVQGAEGDRMRPAIRDQLRRAGVASMLITPFGVGSDMLGLIVACRLRPGHPWTRDETDAVESIATDLGRGLHHARLYEAENRLVQELQTVDQAKSDFLATVSHELRTPLTSIAGYLEILRDRDAGPLTQAQERMLETVDRNTARLRHLIEDVLTLSRIESGAFTTVKMPVNLTDVIAAAVAALRPAAAAKDISLSLSHPGPDGSLVVAGDPGQLDRVLMNLLSNAVKFTSTGGSIRVSASTEQDMALMEVTDNGLGIPASDQQELFGRFFRASNAVERSIPGTGLGLAIVRTIVDNHAGEITIDSQEGEGTTVLVKIPMLGSAGRGRGAARHEPAARIAAGGEVNRSVAGRAGPGGEGRLA